MKRFALIVDDRVHEIVELPDDADITERYHSSLQLETAGPAVRVGWSWDGSAIVPPPVAQPPSIAELIAFAANLRWRKEIGGILVEGVPVATDDRSKVMIVGARVAAAVDPQWTTIWHGSNGSVYPIDAAAMIAISDAVQSHVNAGFTTFASAKAAIEAGTITTFEQVEDAFAL